MYYQIRNQHGQRVQNLTRGTLYGMFTFSTPATAIAYADAEKARQPHNNFTVEKIESIYTTSTLAEAIEGVAA